ncbi:hypothetical protein KY336_03545 [Candidatus Woesearchaeota archaeon]|nr:hypothetical protein [Candidatus Woesearchaeota archaeon]
MAYTKTSLCQLGKLSCFGCCGYDYSTPKEVREGIQKNTMEYKDCKTHKEFAKRSRAGQRRWCGVCRNVIFMKDKKGVTRVLCPLHPKMNKGKEMRNDQDCLINYLCKTAVAFNRWNKKKQERFIKFLKSKKLNVIEYSLGMDNDRWLKEFEDLEF